MKNLKVLALAATAAIALVSPALADTITYNFSGTFDGVNGGPFTNATADFTGIGDTNGAYFFDGDTNITIVPLSSFSAVSSGTTYTFAPMNFFVNRSQNFAGFLNQNLSAGFIRFLGTASGALSGYDGISALPSTGVTFYTDLNTGAVGTDRGDVLVLAGRDLTLSASITGAVPEPATWAMMIGGLGMVGGALRRRKVSTKVSFA